MAKPLLFYRKYQRSLRLKACGFSQRAKRSAWKMRQQGAKRVGAPKVRCGFSQRAKRSAWKMRQQGAKRVGAPKVRCGFPRLQPVRKMRQQGAQRVGALKVRCMHRSTLARAFLSQAMPGPKTLPLQVGMLYNSRLLTCRSAHQSIHLCCPATKRPGSVTPLSVSVPLPAARSLSLL